MKQLASCMGVLALIAATAAGPAVAADAQVVL
jgi:hypothetical protein